ncbi:MAG: hypothetical protein GY774_17840 [Planctomycetes bacterium]|nr:hypothetical protein [Planctomycetota bacterium]
MNRTISILVVCGIFSLMCLTSCSSRPDQPASPAEAAVVTHPTEAGSYVNGDWEYECQVFGETLKHRRGILKYKGNAISQARGTVLTTPLGKFMTFDILGGQIGYNTGWLMTVFVHNDPPNQAIPVFLANGEANPVIFRDLPIPVKRESVKEIPIRQITKN